MDQIDKKIVELLQSNAKISMKDLAEAVHLSSPSVTERVRKLEEQQIIEGYHAHISLKKMNRPISALILFESTDCKSLANFCRNHPDVLECHRVAGEISYIVKLATNSVESLEQFIDDSMQYGTPSTNIVLSSYENRIIAPFISEE
ncbi:Lrp/AsnC family transcriptional regulator [Paenibacillus popilliae]|uniref:Lrp/AsnC family transcriptional regulator n=1 Tax=Paenibacillus popilliae TaxID=78057 RepID=A0ABY3AJ96_PAEPP|nr:Lrp/AsnC family transcriptional regulator [Paenibacillus sp. SDF0028]TQR42552.1 Lrp/AsnC family transcriptional regulator [Paenibacillus sp. SDF0028]